MKASLELLTEFSGTYLEISTPWMRLLLSDKELSQVKSAFEAMIISDDRKKRRAIKNNLAEILAGIVDQYGDLLADELAGIVLDMSRTFRNLFIESEATTTDVFFWINSSIKKDNK